MKAKTAILLAILLAAAIGLLAVRESDWLAPDRADEEPNGVLFPEAGFTAVKLAVSPVEGEKLVFTRTEGNWRITEPVQADAVDWRVDRLAALLQQLSYQRAIDPGDPDEISSEMAGLTDPLWTLTAIDANGNTRSLRIGRPVARIGASEPRTYVQPQGESRIFVVTRDFTSLLAKPTSDYRELELFRVSPQRIVSLAVTGKESFALTRGEDGWMAVRQGVTARADPDKAEELVEKLARLKADAYVTDAATPTKQAMYGLSDPSLTVRIVIGQEDDPNGPVEANTLSRSIRFSAPSGDRVFVATDDSNAVYQVNKSLLQSLQPDWKTLRTSRVVHINPSAIRRVTLRDGDQTTRLVRGEGDDWSMESPWTGPASPAQVGRMIQDLGDLVAQEWRDNPDSLAALGLKKPRRTVTLRAGDGETPTTLEIGSVDGNSVFVRAAGAGSVAFVKKDALESVYSAPDGLWNRQLMEVGPDERVSKIRLEHIAPKGLPSVTAARTKEGNWMLAEPVSVKADGETIQGILQQTRRMIGRRTVALGKIPSKYTDSDKHVKVRLTVEPAATGSDEDANQPTIRTIVLHVVDVGGSAFAWREDETPRAVREFPEGLYVDLSAELRKRALFEDLKEQDLATVEISGPKDAEWTLSRKDDTWSGKAAGDDELADASRALSLVEDLLAMRADRFLVHDKTPAKSYGLDKPSWTITIKPTDGQPRTLRIAQRADDGTVDGHPASLDGLTGVIALEPWRVDGIQSALADLPGEEK